jgi:dihydroorotate dehydrogenase subfamily 2
MVKRAVRSATKRVYKHVAKPILFKQHPDGVHKRLIKAGKLTQKVPGVKHLPKLWAHQSPLLEQDLMGLHFKNPVGLSAGFDKNIEMAPTIARVGFGFMTGGSVTAEQCAGNPKPWFHRLPHTRSLVVHAGLPNAGVAAVARTIQNYPRELFDQMPLAVSVAKTNSPETVDDETAIADYCHSLKVLEMQGRATWYEVNISCPNTFGGEPFTSPLRLEKLLESIDALHLTRPVMVKMPINKSWDEFRALLEVIAKHNIRGVAIGNLLHDREGVNERDQLDPSILGNLSGKPTRKVSTELIRQTYAEFGDRFVIIGIGGIFSAHDAYVKIRAGASLVALITGMIFEGPQVVGEINAGLERYLKKDGFATIHDAIGADHKTSV